MRLCVLLFIIGTAMAQLSVEEEMAANGLSGTPYYMFKLASTVDAPLAIRLESLGSNVKDIMRGPRSTVILVRSVDTKNAVEAILSNFSKNWSVEMDSVQDAEVVPERSFETTASAPWHLDRIDQITLPLDSTYREAGTGSGAHLYVIDTGIRTTHVELAGRTQTVFVTSGESSAPCGSHGSWVASIAAGRYNGVARSASIYDLHVSRASINCKFYSSDAIAAYTWILNNGQLPGVINLSFSGPGSTTSDDYISQLKEAGFVVIAAAGNDGSSSAACSNSPARSSDLISAAASRIDDTAAGFSNYGSCVDIWAPGDNIRGAASGSNGDYVVWDGTSASSPVVAGLATVLYASSSYSTAASVDAGIFDLAANNQLSSIGSGSPNILLNHASASSGPPRTGFSSAVGLTPIAALLMTLC